MKDTINIVRSILPLLLSVTIITPVAVASGNKNIDSFSQAKKILHNEIFTSKSDRKTLYCGAIYDDQKKVVLPTGYHSDKYKKRQLKYETEHIVPAENFGRNFLSWREGHAACVDKKGKAYKGRRCASMVDPDYRLMQSDLYNLYPAIGANNAMRRNYNFTMLPSEESDFGTCDMRVENRKVQPPQRSRGVIARTYLYMELTYPRYNMSAQQRKLMIAWDKQYPVTPNECRRAKLIESIQSNRNQILHSRCR